MQVLWNESYSVQIDELDKQHQKLFDLINNFKQMLLSNTASSPIMNIISEVKRYALMHFACEEKVMLEKGYSNIENHKLKHAEFNEKFSFYEDRLLKGRAILPNDIADFLQNWLTSHILEEDKQYAEFYKVHKR
jgi:hemerythrin